MSKKPTTQPKYIDQKPTTKLRIVHSNKGFVCEELSSGSFGSWQPIELRVNYKAIPLVFDDLETAKMMLNKIKLEIPKQNNNQNQEPTSVYELEF